MDLETAELKDAKLPAELASLSRAQKNHHVPVIVIQVIVPAWVMWDILYVPS